MADQSPPTPAIEPIDALKLFNEFQSQSRARGEATLKLVMGVSGGMLTLSVGAVLSGTPAKIPGYLLPSLQLGWGLLFFSIAASLLLMCSMIVATFHMGVRWRRALETKKEGVVFVATWSWLRVANGVVALLILCSFLGGIGLVARVAIGVAGASAAPPQPASAPSSGSGSGSKPSSASMPERSVSAPNPSFERTAAGVPASAAQVKR
jgi:hypothetical protein